MRPQPHDPDAHPDAHADEQALEAPSTFEVISVETEPEAMDRIARAAAVLGLTPERFALEAALEHALVVLESTTVVPGEYFDALLEDLDTPEPAPRLAAAFEQAREHGRVEPR